MFSGLEEKDKTEDSPATEEIGKEIVEILNKNGLETEWDGDANTRILIKNKSKVQSKYR